MENHTLGFRETNLVLQRIQACLELNCNKFPEIHGEKSNTLWVIHGRYFSFNEHCFIY